MNKNYNSNTCKKKLTVFLVHSVESSDLNWKKKKSGGIKIICQSETRDFSAMAFITDHVNALIEQWFPGEDASRYSQSLQISDILHLVHRSVQ